jgi:2-haloacid dehalogenase
VSVRALFFDVFGTLVDWRSSIARALAKAGEAAGLSADWPAAADAWRERYYPSLGTVLRGERAFQPLDVLHAEMLDEVIAERGLGDLDAAARASLVHAWHRLDPWPDAVAGLTAMRERHILTPLSNGGVGLLTRLAKAAALPFDCILSAELAGTYKPDPRVYGLASAYFDIPADRVLMVACHPSDLEGAKRAGLRTAFIPRAREWGRGGTAPDPPDEVDLVATDLIELAAALI